MNILITGGAGFIASNIADRFIKEGHKVIILDNLSTGNERNINKNSIFYKADIRDKSIEDIFKKERIDCISHHAAQISVRISTENPVLDSDINIAGSLNLLQFAVKYKIKKIIFASTGGAIYGEQEYFPANEIHPQNPLSPYGIAKLSVEKYLYYYYLTHGIKYTALRYSNVYGPRQSPHGEAGVAAIFAMNILKGKGCIINGDGEQTRDYIFVEDVVKANLLALNNDMTGAYNVGTGIETSVTDLYNKLIYITGTQPNCKYGEVKDGEQKRSVLSYMKIKEGYGWKPSFNIDDGLKKTVDFFKELQG